MRQKKQTIPPRFKPGDFVRFMVPGGPTMWIQSERAGYATCWYFSDSAFNKVRIPSNALVLLKDTK